MQSKKPSAHVNAKGRFLLGPSPESTMEKGRLCPRRPLIARRATLGRQPGHREGWQGLWCGQGREQPRSKGKEGLEIPRSFLLSSFCLLRGFVP